MNPKHWGALAIIFAAMLWAVDGTVLRPSLYSLDVLSVVFVEHAIALLIMSFFVFSYLKEIKEMGVREWTTMFFIGLLGGVLGGYAITKAIFYVFTHGASISVVLLLQKLQPIFAIALAAILLREKPSKKFFLWVGLALLGSYLLTFGLSVPTFSFTNPTMYAALLALLAAASWGCSTALGKYALQRISFVTSTYVRFAMTSLLSGLLILIMGKTSAFAQFTFSTIGTLFLVALTTGGGAIFLYYWGLKRVRASSATLYELAFPITALFLEYVLQGKTIGPWQALGAVVLTLTIVMLVKEKNSYRNVHGLVVSGKKEGAKYVGLYDSAIRKSLGFSAFHGTLNVKIKGKIQAKVLHTIPGFTKNKKTYGRVFYTFATMNGYPCAILLPKRSSHKDTIELIADSHLRTKFHLKDGDEVIIEY